MTELVEAGVTETQTQVARIAQVLRHIAIEDNEVFPLAAKLVPAENGPSPRVLVRHGLEAELARPLYYELAEIALAEGHEPPGVWSDGSFFALEHSA